MGDKKLTNFLTKYKELRQILKQEITIYREHIVKLAVYYHGTFCFSSIYPDMIQHRYVTLLRNSDTSNKDKEQTEGVRAEKI